MSIRNKCTQGFVNKLIAQSTRLCDLEIKWEYGVQYKLQSVM